MIDIQLRVSLTKIQITVEFCSKDRKYKILYHIQTEDELQAWFDYFYTNEVPDITLYSKYVSIFREGSKNV